MKLKRVLAAVAIAAAGAFSVLTDYPLSSFGKSFCFGRCGSEVQGNTVLLSSGTRYTLYAMDLLMDEGWGYKLYKSAGAFNPIWSEVKTAEITSIWDVYRPAEIVISPDENFLLVRRNTDLPPAPNARGAIWTDLVDIGTEPPRLIGGGGDCCMQEDYARLVGNDEMIATIANGLGVVTPDTAEP